MNRSCRRPGAAAAVLLLAAGAGVRADHMPEILVTGRGAYGDRDFRIEGAELDPGITDASTLMARLPGGASNFNGALSAQLQYRGLSGPRLEARVNGTAMLSGGPNWMDPPLHYAPAPLLARFEFARGIAGVATGAGLGGLARAELVSSRFTGGPAAFQGRLSLSGHSVDEGYNAGGMLGAGGEHHRGHVLFARDEGDDRDFGSGTVAATSYERDFYGVGYGFRAGAHSVSLDWHHTDTDNSGTPALPLDIALFDTDAVSLGYEGELAGFALEARLSYTDIVHRMDNFSLRPAPDFTSLPLPPFTGPDRRFIDATGERLGARVAASRPAAGGLLRFGFEASLDEHSATVGDPDFAPFFIDNFNTAESDRYSAFVQWRGAVTERLSLEAGLRYLRTEQDARAVDAQPAQLADATGICVPGAMPVPPPCAVRALRDRFNAADRSRSVDQVNWVLRLPYRIDPRLSLELALARKTRAPSYIERYLWIPLEVNAGLGDGNNYIGRVDLDAEVSHELELAVDWRSERAYFAPRAYYKRIDDFIQGEPVAASPATMPIIGVSANANGDPTPLQFTNVDAELYGLDLMAGAELAGPLRADAVFSYVRGQRRDIDDDLFRIAPPSLRLTLAWDARRWLAQLETVLTARQEHISQRLTDDPANPNNSDRETPGYVLLNLRGRIELAPGLRLNLGIENLLDKTYTDHLSGFNRARAGDAPPGQRLPGAGINGRASLSYEW